MDKTYFADIDYANINKMNWSLECDNTKVRESFASNDYLVSA